MVALTDSARTVIGRLVEGSADGATGLRIAVKEGGCAGLQYMLGLERAALAEDQVFDFGGVQVFVDPVSLPLLRDLRIDFIESLESSGFVFENPNAAERCSCGKSFAA